MKKIKKSIKSIEIKLGEEEDKFRNIKEVKESVEQ
jgi:hypothetical protein